jgi:hypothetical protein
MTTLKSESIMIAFVSMCLLPVCDVAAKPLPGFVKVNNPYDPYRPKLQKQGWRPVGKTMREAGSCAYDERCDTYPEARECSGTGLGFCNMVWKHRDGTIIVITTAGEDDLVVTRLSKQ